MGPVMGIKDNLDLRLANQIEDDAKFKKMKNIRLSSEERCDVKMSRINIPRFNTGPGK